MHKIKSLEYIRTVSVFFKFYCVLDSSSVCKILGFIILDNQEVSFQVKFGNNSLRLALKMCLLPCSLTLTPEPCPRLFFCDLEIEQKELRVLGVYQVIPCFFLDHLSLISCLPQIVDLQIFVLANLATLFSQQDSLAFLSLFCPKLAENDNLVLWFFQFISEFILSRSFVLFF